VWCVPELLNAVKHYPVLTDDAVRASPQFDMQERSVRREQLQR
jgi:hypothetical protein